MDSYQGASIQNQNMDQNLKSLGKGFRVISISSGKGGVGKTLTTVNFATTAARLGKKVLILDGDLGLANVDVVLGLSPRYNINDVIEGSTTLQEIILEGPFGIKIIPSGSGIPRLTKLSYTQRINLFDQIQGLSDDFDLMFIDTGAGISDSVVHLNAVADQLLIVTTPEPHALTDAYAMVKVMFEQYRKNKIHILINMVHTEQEAQRSFRKLADVAEKFLGIRLINAGYVPTDPTLSRYVNLRQVGSPHASHTIAGQAWSQKAQSFFSETLTGKSKRDANAVWRELIWATQDQRMARV